MKLSLQDHFILYWRIQSMIDAIVNRNRSKKEMPEADKLALDSLKAQRDEHWRKILIFRNPSLLMQRYSFLMTIRHT